MKILHYSLGLPPYRTGGLAKYSVDLMKAEIQLGNDIYLLYPGHFNVLCKTKIIKNSKNNNMKIYEIVNPLPVTLLGGVSCPTKLYKKINSDKYVEFLQNVKPDIIHIHTLMGLHKEFLEAAKKLGIKTVFTTHDYFGLCPTVNFIDYKGQLCEDCQQGAKCARCNINGYSLKLIYIMQSKIYKKFKDNKLIKKVRLYKKFSYRSNKYEDGKFLDYRVLNYNEYINLRKYYLSMFDLIDYFHFNSTVAREQYRKYINVKGEVINISHNDIRDNRQLKFFGNDKLKITYLGSIEEYKGYPLLIESLNELIKLDITNWHLSIYGNTKTPPMYDNKFYTYGGCYDYSNLRKIFNNTDVLVIPSICNETFGYIGLEAMSYGVPTVASNSVGFKDMIENDKTGIISSPNKKEFSIHIKELINNREKLRCINRNILKIRLDFTMDKHAKKIIDLYKKLMMQTVN